MRFLFIVNKCFVIWERQGEESDMTLKFPTWGWTEKSWDGARIVLDFDMLSLGWKYLIYIWSYENELEGEMLGSRFLTNKMAFAFLWWGNATALKHNFNKDQIRTLVGAVLASAVMILVGLSWVLWLNALSADTLEQILSEPCLVYLKNWDGMVPAS